MNDARHSTDYQYDFGIWPSTRKIRALLADVPVPPEVHWLLDHIDGMTLVHTKTIEGLRRKARPAEDAARVGRELMRQNIYK
jgi:hypothetical protein